jgi:hypothetical protein
LDKDDFDADACEWFGIHYRDVGLKGNADLKVKLANSTESEIKSLQSSLRASKDDVASDLRRNVFKK